MSLHRYRIDLSALSPNVKNDLIENIEEISFNGFSWYPDLLGGEFYVDELHEKSAFNRVKIPSQCNLTRL